jgi:hypothetical protein
LTIIRLDPAAELKQLRAREREREAAEQARQKAEGEQPT